MKQRSVIICSIVAASFMVLTSGIFADIPKDFPLNNERSLLEWKEKIFQGRVVYFIEAKQEDGYLSAVSKKSCSGLMYRIKFRIDRQPMMSWQWKVVKFPDKTASAEHKGGWIEKDDYAARVYVIFPEWNFLNTKSLEYVWDKDLPEGTIMSSPYSDNIKLIVAESGEENKGKWVFEERNVYEDHKKAFGKDSKAYQAGAIALMTDADNTLSTAEAFYKNIRVGYSNE